MNRHAYTDLLTDLGAAKDPAALQRVCLSFAESCGVSNLLVSVVRNDENGKQDLSALFETLPLELHMGNVKRRHANFTPMVLELIGAKTAFDSTAAPTRDYREEFERVWAEYRHYARCDYFYVVPVADDSAIRGFAAYYADRDFLSLQNKTALQVLTQSGYERMQQLGVLRPAANPLTRRQADALAYCARGKSDWEIGEAMSIAETTALEHIEAAKRRLGVRTRVQAAVVAVQRGWIRL
jgi:LuxR family transcriptional regulator, activator of conjugal transfer of Ti plasmids